MTSIRVKIVNKSSNSLPEYSTIGSSGLDLRASLEASIQLKSLERVVVPTGLFLEIPQGFEVQVRPRSGLAMKQGLTCLNSPGTIDSDYRGEIKIILINLSGEDQVIHNGDRIAQMVLQKVEKVLWQPVDELEESQRSTGGFGHTGKN